MNIGRIGNIASKIIPNRIKVLGPKINAVGTKIKIKWQALPPTKRNLLTNIGIGGGIGLSAGVLMAGLDQFSPFYGNMPGTLNAFKAGTILLGSELNVLYFGGKVVLRKFRPSGITEAVKAEKPATIRENKVIEPAVVGQFAEKDAKLEGAGDMAGLKGELAKNLEEAADLKKRIETLGAEKRKALNEDLARAKKELETLEADKVNKKEEMESLERRIEEVRTDIERTEAALKDLGPEEKKGVDGE
ncbi:MAG: hypothetical protein ABH860_01275 [bacterium]